MNLANKLTILRLIMVPIFIIMYFVEKNNDVLYLSTLVFVIASITDFLDGFVARKYNMITDFGKFLDPLADKIIVTAALLILLEIKRVDFISILIIISREYSISIIRAIAASKGKVIAAANSGKIKTVLQMLSIFLLLLNIPFGIYVFYASVAMTIYSGGEYIYNSKTLFFE